MHDKWTTVCQGFDDCEMYSADAHDRYLQRIHLFSTWAFMPPVRKLSALFWIFHIQHNENGHRAR